MSVCQFCHINSRQDEAREGKLTFHRFPVHHKKICDKWVAFCGVDFQKEMTKPQLCSSYLCSRHFDQDSFMSSISNRLKPFAIPSKGGCVKKKVSKVEDDRDYEDDEDVLELKDDLEKQTSTEKLPSNTTNSTFASSYLDFLKDWNKQQH